MQRALKGSPKITSTHGQRTTMGLFGRHLGYDYSVPVGTAVYAPEAGTIRLVTTSASLGNQIELGSAGYYHRFAHLSKFNVKVGQKVAEGALIGWSGNTGQTTGPHLHHDTRVPSAWNASFNNFVDWEAKLRQPATPTAPGVNKSVIGKTVYLSASVEKWRVYNVNTKPQSGKEIAFILPKKYGGLSYRILDQTFPNTVVIQTSSFGRVGIYLDKDATIR